MTDVTTPTNGKSTVRDPLPPSRQKVSMRPAFVVLGLAIAIVVVFSVASVLTNPTTPSTKQGAGTVTSVPGVPFDAQPAAHALSAIESGGDPPANIVDAVTIPVGASAVSSQNNTVDQYDAQVRFSVAATEAQLITFYSAELPRLGWAVSSKGPATYEGKAVYEVLATKAGDDGNQWEIGAVISPTNFTGSGQTNVTPFTVRLFQVADDS